MKPSDKQIQWFWEQCGLYSEPRGWGGHTYTAWFASAKKNLFIGDNALALFWAIYKAFGGMEYDR